MSHSSRCSRPANQSGLRDWWRKRPGYFSTSRPAEPPALWRSWSVKESSNDRIRLRAFLRTLFCRLEELLPCGGGHPLLFPLTGRVVSYVMFKAGGLIYAKPLSSPRRRNQGGLSQHGYWDKMTPTRSRLWIFRARRGCHDGCRVCQLSHGG